MASKSSSCAFAHLQDMDQKESGKNSEAGKGDRDAEAAFRQRNTRGWE